MRLPSGYSASSMSMTMGFVSSRDRAFSTVGASSPSVITARAPPWRSMKAMVSASRRVFSVFSTAPHIGTPKCASIIAGMLGAMIATVSFRPIPRRASAEARRRQRA
jgi:hypothetical protein